MKKPIVKKAQNGTKSGKLLESKIKSAGKIKADSISNRMKISADSILKNHITLFLHPNDHPQDSDIIEIDEFGRILKIHGYPHTENVYLPNLVNAALYWVKKDALKKWKFNQHMLDFAKDLFPIMLKEGFYLRGYKLSLIHI